MRVIFSRCDSVESKAIQWFEGSRFSHCATLTDDGDVIQTLWATGVQSVTLAEFLAESTDWVMYEVVLKDEAAAQAFTKAQLGKPYDKAALWGIALLRNWEYDNAWYCSELVCATLQAGGVALEGAAEYKRVGVRLALEFVNGLKQGETVRPYVEPNPENWNK